MWIDEALPVRVRGIGTALPAGPPVRNADLLALDPDLRARRRPQLEELGARLEAKYGVAERYLVRRPGRDRASAGMTSEDLAAEAFGAALDTAGGGSPSLLIHGTTTTSRYTGSQAAAILGRLGIVAPAYDIKAGCSTSLASLHMAAAFLRSGYPDVAVACAETLSKVMHPDVRETWFGLADGAAALWLARDDLAPEFVITRSYFSTDGRHVDLYTTRGQLPPTVEAIEANGYCLQGDKDQLADLARARYAAMLDAVLPASDPSARVDWIIPHQVNRALIDAVLRPRGLDDRVVWDAREVGNLGGASVLFSLACALGRGQFERGQRILLMSVGGGLSAAAQVWEKS